jgi:ABC-type nitrate/sulfonate/bicarbonate transport system substrate-binding protein
VQGHWSKIVVLTIDAYRRSLWIRTSAQLLRLVLMIVVAPSLVESQVKNLEPIRIGYSGIGITHDLLKIMTSRRIFDKHGLSAQSILFSGLLNQAAVSGGIDFTTSDLPSQIQAAVSGLDFKILSVTHNRLDGAMVVRRGISKPGELMGKRLAISRFGSVSDLVTRLVLRHWKLEPVKDVVLLQVGNTPSRIAALLSEHVDGGLIQPTDVERVIRTGCCVVLSDLENLDIPYARFGVAALGSVIRSRPDTAQKLLESMVEGIYYYKTHPEEGVEILISRGIDRGTAQTAYQKVADSYRISPDPEIDSIKGVLDTLPEERARSIFPASLIDPKPWEQVVKSGILERLYGKLPRAK